ncbi:hypothetical protein YC2023_109453 [Brassica napus]
MSHSSSSWFKPEIESRPSTTGFSLPGRLSSSTVLSDSSRVGIEPRRAPSLRPSSDREARELQWRLLPYLHNRSSTF